MTPPTASAPYKWLPPPRTTSTRSMAACGTLSQYTHPPNASLSGTPSASTSDRFTPEPPSPRIITVCVVGLATRDEGNKVKPGTIFSASSIDSCALVISSEPGKTAAVTVGSVAATSLRLEVTWTASKNGAGSSATLTFCVVPLPTRKTFLVKPGAATIRRISPGVETVKLN